MAKCDGTLLTKMQRQKKQSLASKLESDISTCYESTQHLVQEELTKSYLSPYKYFNSMNQDLHINQYEQP